MVSDAELDDYELVPKRSNPYASANQTANSAALINYLSPYPALADIVLEFKGVEWDEDKKKYVKPRDKPPLVDKPAGIHWVIRTLKPYFTVSAVANSFHRDLVNKYMIDLAKRIKNTLKMAKNLERFGINEYDIPQIIGIMMECASFQMMRSIDSGDRELLNDNIKMIQHERIQQINDGSKDRRFLSPFRRRKDR